MKRILLLKADVPCPLGYVYTAECLRNVVKDDPNLWYEDGGLYYVGPGILDVKGEPSSPEGETTTSPQPVQTPR